MNVHPVNMYWSCYVGFSRIPRPQGRDFFVGKIPKGLLFEVLVMRVMKVTNLRAYYAGKKAMWLVKVWHVTMFLLGAERLKEWAKQVDQMLLITRGLKNWNGILHVSTKDGKSFWKDWMVILQLTQRFWCWNLVWETTRLAGTTTTTTTRTTATWLKDPTGLLPEAV